jgi:hypothetical protein
MNISLSTPNKRRKSSQILSRIERPTRETLAFYWKLSSNTKRDFHLLKNGVLLDCVEEEK